MNWAGTEPVHTRSGDGPAYWLDGMLWTLLLTGEQTGGRQAMTGLLCPQGKAFAPHRHAREDETINVFAGEASVMFQDRAFSLDSGEQITIPRMTAHEVRIKTPVARLSSVYVPAGIEEMVMELGTPTVQRTLLPRGLRSCDAARAAEVARRCGITPA